VSEGEIMSKMMIYFLFNRPESAFGWRGNAYKFLYFVHSCTNSSWNSTRVMCIPFFLSHAKLCMKKSIYILYWPCIVKFKPNYRKGRNDEKKCWNDKKSALWSVSSLSLNKKSWSFLFPLRFSSNISETFFSEKCRLIETFDQFKWFFPICTPERASWTKGSSLRGCRFSLSARVCLCVFESQISFKIMTSKKWIYFFLSYSLHTKHSQL